MNALPAFAFAESYVTAYANIREATTLKAVTIKPDYWNRIWEFARPSQESH